MRIKKLDVEKLVGELLEMKKELKNIEEETVKESNLSSQSETANVLLAVYDTLKKDERAFKRHCNLRGEELTTEKDNLDETIEEENSNGK